VESANTFLPGNYYRVIGIVDRAAQQSKIYVDGVLQGVVDWPNNAETRPYGDTNWKIGIAAPGWSTWSWPANANIADVRLYSHSLLAAEIEAIGAGNSF
jgi:hypothetical protein